MPDMRKGRDLPLQRIELTRARGIAESVVRLLGPYCMPGVGGSAATYIAVAGSIRRHRPWVHAIDVVLAPDPAKGWEFHDAVHKLGVIRKSGPKIIQLDIAGNVQLDLYLASPETWATLLLIRTGSAGHNIKLCQRASTRGYKLHADGSGLEETDTGRLLRPRDEEEIFARLGLPYKRPEERE